MMSYTYAQNPTTERPQNDVKDFTYTSAQWKKLPRFSINLDNMPVGEHKVIVHLAVDAMGNLENAFISESSNIPELDQYVLQQIKLAKFFPYYENGVAVPFISEQPFEFSNHPDQPRP